MNKKAQLGSGPLFNYWKLLIYAISSVFGTIIIYYYVFKVAFMGFIKPILTNILLTSTLSDSVKASILQNYANIPIYLGVAFFILLMSIGVYVFVFAFKQETENV